MHLFAQQRNLPSIDFKKANAYWISPSGTTHPVKTTHIQEVIDHPEEFNTTLNEIKKVYQECKENIGLEGKARDKIMADIIHNGNGWIRIRYDRGTDYYSIEVGKINKIIKEHINQWAIKTLEIAPSRGNTIVAINMFLSRDILIKCSLMDLPEKILSVRDILNLKTG